MRGRGSLGALFALIDHTEKLGVVAFLTLVGRLRGRWQCFGFAALPDIRDVLADTFEELCYAQA